MKKMIVLFLMGILFSCANHPTQEEVVAPGPLKPSQTATLSIEAKQVAAEQKADHVTEIKFNRGRADLTGANKKKLDQFFKNASAKGSIQEVKIMSWSDKNLPLDHKQKLSSEQIALAADRNQSIQDYFKNLNKDLKIKTYSMAQPASSFKEFIGASEARIKESLSTSPGRSQASKSIIMMTNE